jgi:chemotaxis protein histidine kinase CheA
MSADVFADRLARVRQRFVSTLDSKIEDAYAAISKLSDVAPMATTSIVEVYRSIHGVVGIGPTVGFPSTGRAAREVEDVLRGPYQNRRGLTADEILLFEKRLCAFREAAARELQSFHYGLTASQ